MYSTRQVEITPVPYPVTREADVVRQHAAPEKWVPGEVNYEQAGKVTYIFGARQKDKECSGATAGRVYVKPSKSYDYDLGAAAAATGIDAGIVTKKVRDDLSLGQSPERVAYMHGVDPRQNYIQLSYQGGLEQLATREQQSDGAGAVQSKDRWKPKPRSGEKAHHHHHKSRHRRLADHPHTSQPPQLADPALHDGNTRSIPVEFHLKEDQLPTPGPIVQCKRPITLSSPFSSCSSSRDMPSSLLILEVKDGPSFMYKPSNRMISDSGFGDETVASSSHKYMGHIDSGNASSGGARHESRDWSSSTSSLSASQDSSPFSSPGRSSSAGSQFRGPLSYSGSPGPSAEGSPKARGSQLPRTTGLRKPDLSVLTTPPRNRANVISDDPRNRANVISDDPRNRANVISDDPRNRANVISDNAAVVDRVVGLGGNQAPASLGSCGSLMSGNQALASSISGDLMRINVTSQQPASLGISGPQMLDGQPSGSLGFTHSLMLSNQTQSSLGYYDPLMINNQQPASLGTSRPLTPSSQQPASLGSSCPLMPSSQQPASQGFAGSLMSTQAPASLGSYGPFMSGNQPSASLGFTGSMVPSNQTQTSLGFCGPLMPIMQPPSTSLSEEPLPVLATLPPPPPPVSLESSSSILQDSVPQKPNMDNQAETTHPNTITTLPPQADQAFDPSLGFQNMSELLQQKAGIKHDDIVVGLRHSRSGLHDITDNKFAFESGLAKTGSRAQSQSIEGLVSGGSERPLPRGENHKRRHVNSESECWVVGWTSDDIRPDFIAVRSKQDMKDHTCGGETNSAFIGEAGDLRGINRDHKETSPPPEAVYDVAGSEKLCRGRDKKTGISRIHRLQQGRQGSSDHVTSCTDLMKSEVADEEMRLHSVAYKTKSLDRKHKNAGDTGLTKHQLQSPKSKSCTSTPTKKLANPKLHMLSNIPVPVGHDPPVKRSSYQRPSSTPTQTESVPTQTIPTQTEFILTQTATTPTQTELILIQSDIVPTLTGTALTQTETTPTHMGTALTQTELTSSTQTDPCVPSLSQQVHTPTSSISLQNNIMPERGEHIVNFHPSHNSPVCGHALSEKSTIVGSEQANKCSASNIPQSSETITPDLMNGSTGYSTQPSRDHSQLKAMTNQEVCTPLASALDTESIPEQQITDSPQLAPVKPRLHRSAEHLFGEAKLTVFNSTENVKHMEVPDASSGLRPTPDSASSGLRPSLDSAKSEKAGGDNISPLKKNHGLARIGIMRRGSDRTEMCRRGSERAVLAVDQNDPSVEDLKKATSLQELCQSMACLLNIDNVKAAEMLTTSLSQRQDLVEGLDADAILDYLSHHGVLDPGILVGLDDKASMAQRNSAILRHVEEHGNTAVALFINALRQSGQLHLASSLDTEQRIKPVSGNGYFGKDRHKGELTIRVEIESLKILAPREPRHEKIVDASLLGSPAWDDGSGVVIKDASDEDDAVKPRSCWCFCFSRKNKTKSVSKKDAEKQKQAEANRSSSLNKEYKPLTEDGRKDVTGKQHRSKSQEKTKKMKESSNKTTVTTDSSKKEIKNKDSKKCKPSKCKSKVSGKYSVPAKTNASSADQQKSIPELACLLGPQEKVAREEKERLGYRSVTNGDQDSSIKAPITQQPQAYHHQPYGVSDTASPGPKPDKEAWDPIIMEYDQKLELIKLRAGQDELASPTRQSGSLGFMCEQWKSNGRHFQQKASQLCQRIIQELHTEITKYFEQDRGTLVLDVISDNSVILIINICMKQTQVKQLQEEIDDDSLVTKMEDMFFSRVDIAEFDIRGVKLRIALDEQEVFAVLSELS